MTPLNLERARKQYCGQFLIAYRRIRVSRLQGKFATNGKSMVSEYELKTVRTIGKSCLCKTLMFIPYLSKVSLQVNQKSAKSQPKVRLIQPCTHSTCF